MATSHEKEHKIYNGVSTGDVPNAAWGWSEMPRGAIQWAGWLTVILLVGFNFGNHEGHVETIWLLVLAALTAIGLIIFALEPKLSQSRRLTMFNKPAGHQEPDWTYDQATLSGAYENLTDSQLRALNIDPARVSHLRAVDSAKPTKQVEN